MCVCVCVCNSACYVNRAISSSYAFIGNTVQRYYVRAVSLMPCKMLPFVNLDFYSFESKELLLIPANRSDIETYYYFNGLDLGKAPNKLLSCWFRGILQFFLLEILSNLYLCNI